MISGATYTLKIKVKAQIDTIQNIIYTFADRDFKVLFEKTYPGDAVFEAGYIYIPLTQAETEQLQGVAYIEGQINFSEGAVGKTYARKIYTTKTLHTHTVTEDEPCALDNKILDDIVLDLDGEVIYVQGGKGDPGEDAYTSAQKGGYSGKKEDFYADLAGACALESSLKAHTSKTDNPHKVTKAQVGLGNVDNTADLDKPVSTKQQAAIDGLISQNSAFLGTPPLNSYLIIGGMFEGKPCYAKSDIGYMDVLGAINGAENNAEAIEDHIADVGNPHAVTKDQIGLGNVDNPETGTFTLKVAGQTDKQSTCNYLKVGNLATVWGEIPFWEGKSRSIFLLQGLPFSCLESDPAIAAQLDGYYWLGWTQGGAIRFFSKINPDATLESSEVEVGLSITGQNKPAFHFTYAIKE